MKKTSKIFALLLALMLVLSLAACGKETNDSKSNTEPTGTDTPASEGDTGNDDTTTGGNVLNVQFDVEVASLDPQIATDGTSFEVIAATTEGLYSVDAAGTPILAMAEKVDKSEDGLTYTFTL